MTRALAVLGGVDKGGLDGRVWLIAALMINKVSGRIAVNPAELLRDPSGLFPGSQEAGSEAGLPAHAVPVSGHPC